MTRGPFLAFQKKFTLACALFLTFAVCLVGLRSSLLAQEKKDGDAKAASKESEKKEVEAPTTDTSTPAAPTPPPDESLAEYVINYSGPFGFLILIASILLVYYVSLCLIQYRKDSFIPTAFVEQFEQKLQAKDYQGAFELSKNEESFIGRILNTGLGRLNKGYEEAEKGMQEIGEDEQMTIDHRLSIIGLIASISTMLGLSGTVQGMIMSFSEIAKKDVAPKPKELAVGISTALLTTIEGLCVAMPALIAFALIKNRTERLMQQSASVADGLMSRFATVGKPKPAGGAAPAAAPAKPAE